MKEVSCKVLFYLKRSSLTASGLAPIMCRVTVGRSMVQFSSKLTCTPALWNVRKWRLSGKSREAVETNARIEKLLLGIHEAVKSLSSRPGGFDAEAVKNQYQGSLETRMTLLRLLDRYIEELRSRGGYRLRPDHAEHLRLYATLARSLYPPAVRTPGPYLRPDERTVHPRISGFHADRAGLCPVDGAPLPGRVKKICRLAFKEGHSE